MSFRFALLSPRPQDGAANDAIFASGAVYGVEVTIPALAARCVTNLDPQHTGGDASRAAIEDAIDVEMPPEGSTLVTVRADLDALGAMGVFMIRDQFGGQLPDPSISEDLRARIAQVATADKFARGGYPGPKPLPTAESPWDESSASAESSRPLAAIAAAIADFKVPMEQRVAAMVEWLVFGREPASYRASVERERADMIAALQSGAIRHETRADGRIAVVESTHRAATSVGYSLAPVVVARNPSFKAGPSEPVVKYTICQFAAGFADIKAALAELATLEAGWGGSPNIGGSPQGVSSTLTIDQVVDVVAKHLRS